MRRRRSLVALGALCWCLAPSAHALSLRELLNRVVEEHPKAAVFSAQVAEGEASVLAAQGEFDLEVGASAGRQWAGKYPQQLGELSLSQPTPFWGAEVSLKYQNGADFPIYDGKNVTSTWGRAALALLVPLLRDGPIDHKRMQGVRAKLELAMAKEQARMGRSELLADATMAWWKWIAAAHKRAVYESLVKLAEERERYLEAQVAQGLASAIEVVENSRMVATRRALLVQARLAEETQALKVAYYGQRDGVPAELDHGAIPAEFPLPPSAIGRDFEALQANAATIRILELARNLVLEERRLTENQQLPRLDAELGVSHSAGDTRPIGAGITSLSETNVMLRVQGSWEPARRKALGKATAWSRKLDQLDGKLTLERQELKMQLNLAELSTRAAIQGAELQAEATKSAEALAGAEWERFRLGQSSLLQVNLRDETVLNARLAEIDARSLAWSAYLDALRAVTAAEPSRFYAGVESHTAP